MNGNIPKRYIDMKEYNNNNNGIWKYITTLM